MGETCSHCWIDKDEAEKRGWKLHDANKFEIEPVRRIICTGCLRKIMRFCNREGITL